MKKIYKVTGMTCQHCARQITEKLNTIEGVEDAVISLEKNSVALKTAIEIPLVKLNSVLPDAYGIKEKEEVDLVQEKLETPSKLKQLKPLAFIFVYLIAATIGLHFSDWNTSNAMLDFMGLFFIVFSFFKLLDLKGFSRSFEMYDPLAKRIPGYGRIYPFLELILGLCFLLRFQLIPTLLSTVVILGITTIGVTQVLLNKRSIECACLGTVLKLPMTKATFIENTIMIAMACWMLFA